MKEPTTFEEACYIVAKEIAELVISKQHDYGHDNILAFGEFGVCVRATDKIGRWKTLLNKTAANEPRRDTWRDLGGYAIIAEMLYRDWFKLELK